MSLVKQQEQLNVNAPQTHIWASSYTGPVHSGHWLLTHVFMLNTHGVLGWGFGEHRHSASRLEVDGGQPVEAPHWDQQQLLHTTVEDTPCGQWSSE